MSLIKVFYKTGEVFTDLGASAWVLPLVALVVVGSLISGLSIVVVGWGPVTDTARVLDSRASQFDAQRLRVLILAGALLKLVFLAVAVAFAALVVYFLVWVFVVQASYSKILAVCLYAVYMRSVFDFSVMLISALYCWILGLPVVASNAARMNMGALIDGFWERGYTYEVARSLDVLTIGAILIAAFGLSKAIPRLALQSAAVMLFLLWVAWALVRMKFRAPL
ncbi:hypothetical protein [Paludibaculum fermentans]|uniref:Yip1 domain-containing protein n=1 Tax=Paludibaculum fermentans TaxID=1473598 RepID=A0A7S7NMN1_PALFE|nr:hypothetical protein [Paludibaculum fermentans]QOY86401.1 hypothetical protein IRI77_26865 [Paludibaculum fermentans]